MLELRVVLNFDVEWGYGSKLFAFSNETEFGNSSKLCEDWIQWP